MISRRMFFNRVAAAVLAAGLPVAVQANDEKPFYVVKLISFSCNFCRESEVGDALLLQEISRLGGELVAAPLDLTASAQFVRESVYYASRALGSEVAIAVRDSLYRATQDRGLSFSSVNEVLTWLESDMPERYVAERMSRLGELATRRNVRDAIGRAVNLAVASGSDYLPAYVLLHQGLVVGLYDRESFPQPAILRSKLLEHIRTLV